MRTMVIVPATMLVRMFGVPESVSMPTKIGLESTFEAYGKRFHCKRLKRDTWILTCPLHSGRTRFGTAAEIAEDIGRILETGSLPQQATSMA